MPTQLSILISLAIAAQGFSASTIHSSDGGGGSKSPNTNIRGSSVNRGREGPNRPISDGSRRQGRFSRFIRENSEIQEALQKALPQLNSSEKDSYSAVIEELRQKLVEAGIPNATETDVGDLIVDFIGEKALSGDEGAQDLLRSSQSPSENSSGSGVSQNTPGSSVIPASRNDTPSLIRGSVPLVERSPPSMPREPEKKEESPLSLSRSGEPTQRLLATLVPTPVASTPPAETKLKPPSESAKPVSSESAKPTAPALSKATAPSLRPPIAEQLAPPSQKTEIKQATPTGPEQTSTKEVPEKRDRTDLAFPDDIRPSEIKKLLLSVPPGSALGEGSSEIRKKLSSLTHQQALRLMNAYQEFIKRTAGANSSPPPPPLYWAWFGEGRMILGRILNESP